MSKKTQFSSAIFSLKPVGSLTPSFQLAAIVSLFVLTTFLTFHAVQTRGGLGNYAVSPMLLFAPIYEEIIFRGFLIIGLSKIYSFRKAIIISCLLFGIWHLKNVFSLSALELFQQVVYAAFIIGPILCWVTWKTRSIWPGVIIHYGNNLIAFFVMPIIYEIIKKTI